MFPVRVLSEEDALRVLVVHFLANGGWRPSGLCDIALAVEASHADGFDLTRCLTDDPVVGGWVQAGAALARDILGARLDGTAFDGARAPGWMSKTLARRWSQPWPADHGVPLDPLPGLTDPVGLVRGLRHRWADPLSATVGMHVGVTGVPRPVVQAAFVARRFGRYARTSR